MNDIRSRFIRIAVWFLAAFFALGHLAEAGPAVLCIGEDGHADIEYSLSNCCVFEALGSAGGSPEESISRHPECDDCVDLGFELISLKKGKEVLPAPRTNTTRILLPEKPDPGSSAWVADRRSNHDSLFPILSATVLLT